MSSEVIKIEQLESGVRAAFVNLPHFRTHSARLTISTGSAHESPGAYGAAHFLEHIVFQGTEDMPSDEEVHQFAEEKGLDMNAVTSQTYTSYVADGYELESVGFLVNQLALRPTLTDEALEGKRKPIIDEFRGRASRPDFYPGQAHAKAMRGDIFARPVIGGAIEDVQRMTPDTLRTFHQLHYKLGNAILVLCSSEPIERQREFAEILTTGHTKAGGDKPEQVELGPFNPSDLDVSLQTIDLPLTAQTSVSICYGVPETFSPKEQLSYNMMSVILSKVAHNRLRRELALCYGANAGMSRLSDLNFGRERNWSQIAASADLNGEDSIQGLQALKDDVLHRPLPESVFDTVRLGFSRDVDHLMQSSPGQIADRVRDILTFSKREEIVLDEVKDFAATITLDTLRKLHKEITDTKPLVLATSPDSQVLATIEEWANSYNS